MTSAVVFAYHDVGIRCLSVLLRHGVKVPLVVTHLDDPAEKVWFGSVADLARESGIRVITPENPNDSNVVREIREIAPDFLFSFYYRRMLQKELLNIPKMGALNMHGSLLPKFRGRVPVNWAVIKGETETGATLHYMTAKPDAGDIVDQEAVPILYNDTAFDVFHKVTDTAEIILNRSLPSLAAGIASRIPQDSNQATYFGKRTPEDGRIDWRNDAQIVHNLVRGVAPPYPGAFTILDGERLKLLKTSVESLKQPKASAVGIYSQDGCCYAICGGNSLLRLHEIEWQGKILDEAALARLLGANFWELR